MSEYQISITKNTISTPSKVYCKGDFIYGSFEFDLEQEAKKTYSTLRTGREQHPKDDVCGICHKKYSTKPGSCLAHFHDNANHTTITIDDMPQQWKDILLVENTAIAHLSKIPDLFDNTEEFYIHILEAYAIAIKRFENLSGDAK